MMAMLPIAPLMIEHRIIERMIRLVAHEYSVVVTTRNPNAAFIKTTVDFFRTYADQTHHGKEENILFRELRSKPLTPDHQQILEELIHEHVTGRQATHALAEAISTYLAGKHAVIDTILEQMRFLTEFYPQHIEKEDKLFFPHVMAYFSNDEQQQMLEEGYVFDRKMIHIRYDRVIRELEEAWKIPVTRRPDNWIDYL
jgi:hemerythrin-like domain-containing protein